MRKKLYVDSTDLSTYGLYISGAGTFGAPEKDVPTYTVPGRNGLVLGSTSRLQNIQVTYPAFICSNFAQNMMDLRSFLLSRNGYVKITDDYDTTHYRKGFFNAGIEPEMTQMLDAGQFNLVFNCLPQRWLLTGDTEQTNPASLTNATRFDAKPLVRIYGYGTLSIGSVDFVIAQHTESYVDVDCETMQVYCGDTNMAAYADFQATENGQTVYNVDPPVLAANATTTITKSGATITSYKITPRWWEV